MKINGKTKILGIIGNPVEHTASPIMHNAVIKKLGLNYVYVPLKVEKNKLGVMLEAIKAANISGVNITIPFKETVIPYLDEIDLIAKQIGAVNTIVNINGTLKGYNTDGQGFLYSLKNIYNISLLEKSVVILGSGGSAKAIAFSLLQEKISELVIINRTLPRAIDLKEKLGMSSKAPILAYSLDDPMLNDLLSKAQLIINTTSMGMEPNINNAPITNFNWIKKDHIIYDIIYKPMETLFIQKAKQKGAKTLSGLEMLIGQGLLSFKLFTGHEAPYEIMKSEVLKELC